MNKLACFWLVAEQVSPDDSSWKYGKKVISPNDIAYTGLSQHSHVEKNTAVMVRLGDGHIDGAGGAKPGAVHCADANNDSGERIKRRISHTGSCQPIAGSPARFSFKLEYIYIHKYHEIN